MDQQLLKEYLKMTGQEHKDLMDGFAFVGPKYVYDLIPQALKEKKKIVWIEEDLQTGKGHYELQDL